LKLAQEIVDSYAKAVQNQHDKSQQAVTSNILGEISGNNGRYQDLRDAYSAVKAEYSQVWLSEIALTGSTTSPSATILKLKNGRSAERCFEEGRRDWGLGKDLPSASSLGLPAATGSQVPSQ